MGVSAGASQQTSDQDLPNDTTGTVGFVISIASVVLSFVSFLVASVGAIELDEKGIVSGLTAGIAGIEFGVLIGIVGIIVCCENKKKKKLHKPNKLREVGLILSIIGFLGGCILIAMVSPYYLRYQMMTR